jgi:hypothetical protein
MAAVGALLNRTITSRGALGVAGALVTVEPDAEVLGAFGDPGMSGATLEGVVEPVDGVDDVDPDDVDNPDDVDDPDEVDWANAAVAPAIRNSSNDFFIRKSPSTMLTMRQDQRP